MSLARVRVFRRKDSRAWKVGCVFQRARSFPLETSATRVYSANFFFFFRAVGGKAFAPGNGNADDRDARARRRRRAVRK